MWNLDSPIRSFTIKIVDASDNPVTTRVLADLEVLFRRNSANCSDALTFLNNGDGTYTISYTPSGYGQDVISVYDAPTDLRFTDVEDIYNFAAGGTNSTGSGGAAYCLNQNFGGAGKLLPPVSDPADYRMLVFASSDWAVNRRSDAYSFGTSAVDAAGAWVTGIYVPAGIYHVVAQKSGTFVIVAANLAVGVS